MLCCCWICTGCATWPNTISSVAYHYVSSLLVRGRSHHCIWGKGQGSVHSNQFRRRLIQICTLLRIFPQQTPMSMYPLLTCSMLDVKLEWQKPKMPKHERQPEMGVLPIPAGVLWSLNVSCSLLSVVLGMIPARGPSWEVPACNGWVSSKVSPVFALSLVMMAVISEVREGSSPVREAEENRYVLSLQLVIL